MVKKRGPFSVKSLESPKSLQPTCVQKSTNLLQAPVKIMAMTIMHITMAKISNLMIYHIVNFVILIFTRKVNT